MSEYNTIFTLTISSWSWIYTPEEFETYKTTLKGWIAQPLGCFTWQLTIDWTWQAGGRRRLLYTFFF